MPVIKLHPGTHWKFPTGAEHGPPIQGRYFLKEQDFHIAAGRLFSPPPSGGENLGIVEDEDIAGLKEFGELGKGAMRDLVEAAVEDHQS